jgi:hypothetical protein
MAGVPLLTRQAAKGAVSNQKENLIMSKQQPGRKPTHGVYHIRGEGKNAYWTKIGAAWIHDDGEGLNLSLEFIPTDTTGRLVIRANKADTQTQGEAAK